MTRMKLIFTYIDDEAGAEAIAGALLKERLAAGVKFWPGKSRYWWKGKIEKKERELNIIIETKESLVDKAVAKIREHHTYKLPVIGVLGVEKFNPGVGEWLDEVTK